MKDPNRFYTYAYLREDRTPYYIGKGSGNRIYDNDGRPCKKPKDKSRIIFLKQNLTEEEAFKHEKYMIAVFGRKDLGTGILHNKTNGGDGSSGWIASEETRRRMSEINVGKTVGKKWWNDGKGNSKRSVECPGEGWVLGMTEETKRKRSLIMKGKNNPNYGKSGIRWWNDGKGNSKRSVECPGEGWILGESENHKINKSRGIKGKNKGKVWWNDGKGNRTLSIECPGEGWILGQDEEHKTKIGKSKVGKKWWNDGKGNDKFSKECPGEGWVLGKGKRKKTTF
jgi:hypothetical protein